MLLAPVQAAADWVATLKGWKRALLAAFAGAISVLAFAPLHVWPVLFLSFGLLVWLLDGCHAGHARLGTRLRCATLIGFWFGFGYFLTGLYWTAEAFLVEPWRHGWLIPFAMTGLAGGMALFYAAAAALAAILWRPGAARVFAVAIAFGLAEFARGHVLTGLPWNLVGYGLAATLPMMQAASIFGVYALSLLALLLFASLFAIWSPQGSGLARPISTALVVLFFSVALAAGAMWGEARLASAGAATTGVRLRIVQANVDQANKWRPENSAEIFNTYLDLTKSGGGAQGLDGITLVVWPETAVPFLLADSSEALHEIGDVLPEGTSLLVGSARVVAERDADGRLATERVYNSLIVVSDKGEILGSYDKVHLVPFGEYLPFQDLMESLGLLAAHRHPRRLQCRHRVSPALDPGRAAGAAAHLLRDHFSRRGRRQFAETRLVLERHQRCLVRHQRWSFSAFSSGTTSRRRARLAGGPRGQHRHLGDHRSLRTRPRRARSEARGSRRRSLARGFAEYEIRNVGTLDRTRGSLTCACWLPRIFSLVREPKWAPAQ